jgi:hypothetical protein
MSPGVIKLAAVNNASFKLMFVMLFMFKMLAIKNNLGQLFCILLLAIGIEF